MDVLNLDKYAGGRAVRLNGETYHVRGLTVEEFINGTVTTRIEDAKDKPMSEFVKVTVDILAGGEDGSGLTDIPKEVLMRQAPAVLTAILLVAQGVDPDTVEADSAKK